VEAAGYMGIPNVIMVRYRGKPSPPFGQFAVPFKALKKVVWSIVGAGGRTAEEERAAVFDLALSLPNMTGVIMDDFFRHPKLGEPVAVLSIEELQKIRQQLTLWGRTLDLWVVLYVHNLEQPVQQHLALCNKLTFWSWKASELDNLERNFELAAALAPRCGKVLGCYMWDYGQGLPMPLDRMEMQCETGLRWLREGRVEGMIFLASCICDIGLETVEWTRRWIAKVGDQPLD
jgi:hypothetical protein